MRIRSKNTENSVSLFPTKYEAAQLFSTLIKINVSWAASNDAENSALITEIKYILKYIAIENSSFKL